VNCSQSTSWRRRAWPITRRVTGSTWCRSVQFSCEQPLQVTTNTTTVPNNSGKNSTEAIASCWRAAHNIISRRKLLKLFAQLVLFVYYATSMHSSANSVPRLPSVVLSATSRYCIETSERNIHISTQSTPFGSFFFVEWVPNTLRVGKILRLRQNLIVSQKWSKTETVTAQQQL